MVASATLLGVGPLKVWACQTWKRYDSFSERVCASLKYLSSISVLLSTRSMPRSAEDRLLPRLVPASAAAAASAVVLAVHPRRRMNARLKSSKRKSSPPALKWGRASGVFL